MKRYIYNVLLVIFVVIFLVAGGMVWRHYSEAKESADAFEAVAEMVKEQPEEPFETEPVEEETTPEPTISEKYLGVYQQNSDFVGWLTIEGTDIDYPVMQTPQEPDYYLKRGFDGSYSRYGVPYMQSNCVIGTSDNLIIYGHNMNNGTMFADLCEYEQEEFYQEHKTVRFDTLYEEAEYEIIAAFKTVAYSDSGFAYHHFVHADDQTEFDSYVSRCRELSLYDTGVSAQYGDQLLTLSTCEYSRTDGRMVIVAKKIQPDSDTTAGNQ